MDAARLAQITDVQHLRDLVAAQVAVIAERDARLRDARLAERDAHIAQRDRTIVWKEAKIPKPAS